MTIATNSRFVRLLFLSIPPSLSLCSAKESTYSIIEVLRNDIISIHAPARGATGYSVGHGFWQRIFQSTLPRGERPGTPGTATPGTDFNPRSREGSDEKLLDKIDNNTISIHAPARGATDARPMTISTIPLISIHAPARGATSCPGI